MEKIENSLMAHRQEAAFHSLGISSDIIYSKVIEKLESIGPTNGKLLDFGAGRGDFLNFVKSQQKFCFELHGIDMMHTLIDGVNWYVQDLNQKLQLKKESFDIVTCIEVIEHLENPRHILRDIHSVLKPGGYVVLTTPNNESWRSLASYIMRGHFVAFTDSSYPAHITSLNRMDISRILQEAGFKNIDFSFTNYGVVPKFNSCTWQRLSLGFLGGLRYSDNVIAVAKKHT